MNFMIVFFILMLVVFLAAAMESARRNDQARTQTLQNRRANPLHQFQPKETPEQKRQRVVQSALKRAAVEGDTLPYQLTDMGVLIV